MKTTTPNTLAGLALAGLKLPRVAELAAKKAEKRREAAHAAKSAAVRVANAEKEYNRRRVEWNFAEAERVENPDDFEEFGEPRPNLSLAQEKAESYRRVADLAQREFEAVFPYAEAFALIDDAWRTWVEFERSIDRKAMTVAELDKLQAEADRLAPLLLSLSSTLAAREFETSGERREFRRAQSTAGVPLNLELWRGQRDKKRAEAAKPREKVAAAAKAAFE